MKAMFKVGQKLVCINATGTAFLKEKDIYTVSGIHPMFPNDAILLSDGKNDNGYHGFWNYRFRPIEDSWVEEALSKVIEEMTNQAIEKWKHKTQTLILR